MPPKSQAKGAAHGNAKGKGGQGRGKHAAKAAANASTQLARAPFTQGLAVHCFDLFPSPPVPVLVRFLAARCLGLLMCPVRLRPEDSRRKAPTTPTRPGRNSVATGVCVIYIWYLYIPLKSKSYFQNGVCCKDHFPHMSNGLWQRPFQPMWLVHLPFFLRSLPSWGLV